MHRLGRLALIGLVAATTPTAPAHVPSTLTPPPSTIDAASFDPGVTPIFTFGLSTFTGKQAQDSLADPSLFRPTQCDVRQWLESVRALGARRVLVTAKQADGFCLWTTATTMRSVRPDDGQPNVLDDLVRACRDQGIECGVVFSWLDRSELDPARRSKLQLGQLRELLTRYPDLAELRLIDTRHPDATDVDLRAVVSMFVDLKRRLTLSIERPDSEDRSLSLRPNWYWRQSENEHVRSAEALEAAWYESVAKGRTLYLGVPPDNRGLIAAPDRDRIADLGDRLRASFVEVRIPTTRTEGTDHLGRATATFALERPRLINRLFLTVETEGPATVGWTIEAETAEGWTPLEADAPVVGRRALRFPAIEARAIRVSASGAGSRLPIRTLEPSCAPPTVTIDAPAFATLEPATVALHCDLPGATIRYTLDGHLPTDASPTYSAPFTLSRPARVFAMATHEGRTGPLAAETITVLDPNRFIDAVQFIRAPDAGLRLRRFDGDFRFLDELGSDFGGAPVVADSIVPTITLPRDRPAASYGLVFQGFIDIPDDGIYTFSMRSDDGSRLFLHNTTVVDHGRGASWEWWQGRVPLRAGWHPIRVEFAQRIGEDRLQVRWSGPGFDEQEIPAARLAH